MNNRLVPFVAFVVSGQLLPNRAPFNNMAYPLPMTRGPSPASPSGDCLPWAPTFTQGAESTGNAGARRGADHIGEE